MHKETRNAVLLTLLLASITQIFINLIFLPNKPSTTHNTAPHTSNTGTVLANPELLQELQNIHYKLDIQAQLIADITHQDLEKIKAATTPPPATAKLTDAEIWQTKQALINDLGQYGMTMPVFLSDPRLQSLPSNAQSEVLSELARRLDNNEINKEEFMPGYKNP